MKMKGSYCLFLALSVWFSQALALDFSYKSDIPTDNKPSEDYLQKRNKLSHENWKSEKLAEANALAEKGENERQEYLDKFEREKNLSFSYDWNEGQFKTSPGSHNHALQHFGEQSKRHCYRATRQRLEREQGNGYSYTDISDACSHF
ncbi:conserved exported protein of unknown function [Xenorhabdus poinarii G6]|uniref:Uncharacterized protein n=2 Tax=Xenorhabdus poinarii TaxID=40577 RepID=A0A068R6Q1_9GAMM|nr:conserved exported protein of unknown function [Xenorhabdus poinarii G6]